MQNLDLGDLSLQTAVGDDLSGAATVDWESGRDLRIPRISLQGEAYSFDGNAVVAPSDEGPAVDGAAEVRANRLSVFSSLAGRSLGGAAELSAVFRAAPLAGTFDIAAKGTGRDLSLDVPRADAILAGVSSLDVKAVRSAEGLTITLNTVETEQARLGGRAMLTSGGSTAELAGRLADGGLLLAGLTGPVEIEIAAREDDARDWSLTASLQGDGLDISTETRLFDLYNAPRANGSLNTKIANISPFSELANLSLGGALDLAAKGSIAFDLSAFQIDAAVKGQDLKLGVSEVDRLLAGDASLDLQANGKNGRTEVSTFIFASPQARAQAQGILEPGASQMDLTARLTDIAPFVAGLNGPVNLEGALEDVGNGRVGLNLLGTGPGGIEARVSGTAAEDFSTFDIDATGTAPLQLANRFIAPTTLSGPVRFDLNLSGPPGLSALTGQISGTGARLVAPEAGMAFSDIAINTRLDSGQATLDVTGRVDGGGRVSVTGPVALNPPNSANLNIDLTAVKITDPRLFETSVTGQVRIDGPLSGGARIAGALTLGLTEIRIPSSGLGGAGAIPEIVHLNEPPPARGTRRRAGLLGRSSDSTRAGGRSFPIDVTITAPNRLFLRGRGLDSEFGGRLRLGGTTRDILPSGGFELIRGRLDILGRRLDLTEARITMQGSAVPRLRLIAATTVEDTRISVEVTGPADQPDIAFRSSPELPQEEVVARLIFGRSIENLSALQAARLALAVRTLAGRGGEGIVGKIRGSTGLADLDVTTSEDGNAAVRAGAYLNENVYTDVTIDSAGETRLNLNLDVTPSLTLKGGVSSEGDTSIGIFFERDY